MAFIGISIGGFNLGDGTVGIAKLEPVATGTILGRASAGTGAVEVLTAAQVLAMLNSYGIMYAMSAHAALL